MVKRLRRTASVNGAGMNLLNPDSMSRENFIAQI
jgi:hypothetical protein